MLLILKKNLVPLSLSFQQFFELIAIMRINILIGPKVDDLNKQLEQPYLLQPQQISGDTLIMQ